MDFTNLSFAECIEKYQVKEFATFAIERLQVGKYHQQKINPHFMSEI